MRRSLEATRVPHISRLRCAIPPSLANHRSKVLTSGKRRIALLLSFPLIFLSLAFGADSYQVVHTYPHDAQAFTQGLVFVDGQLYESTGLNGRSSLRMDDLETGKVLQRQDVPAEYFAEGLTNWRSNLVQLTWQSHKAFVYDRFSFRLLRTFPFEGEGWGLTQDGRNLILSDGTAVLRFLNPDTFQVERRITVTDHGATVKDLNELEYIHGEIYSNVWYSNKIARISPQTGKVLGWIDLSDLVASLKLQDSQAVLNGIAYDARHDRLFVTGKLWPKIFEIKVQQNGGQR
jgi:glutaminyl-peptide cyclotransferase